MCINDPGEQFPCFAYVTLLVTHDSNTFYWEAEDSLVQDSIVAMVIPLAWTRTNSAAYCSLSGYWNEDAMSSYDPGFPRGIWRHFHPSELDSNRMAWLAAQSQELEWSTVLLNLTSDSSWYHYLDDSLFTPPRMWLTIIPGEPTNRKWWEGNGVLLSTFTFRLEESTTLCIDSTFWPPEARLSYWLIDARRYIPRSNLPICFRVYGDTVEVLPTGVRWVEGSTDEEGRPASFCLSQNYPNPFNPVTEFKLSLSRASHVKLEIFNLLGQKVKTAVDGDLGAGEFILDWDGKDERGLDVPSGIYFYRMTAGDFSSVKKMVLLK